MTIYTDQTIAGNFDPGAPPSLPTTISVVTLTLDDADNDGFIRADGSDQVNGSNVVNVWVGDTVTINGSAITGVTFYTADGSAYFTPNDGSVLPDGGSATATTYVTTSTQFDVGDLGPPCFVAGTRIRVPGGETPVEDLRPGDLVETLDHGPRPVRWRGERLVAGQGALAPVRIAPGALGNARELRVSPQHRMLISGWRAELYLGETEVLCPALNLCNGDTIHRAPCDRVRYVHIMFDRHEVIFAEGAPSESFLYGEYLCRKGSAVQREIAALFPELAAAPPPFAARPVPRGFETRLLAVAAPRV